MRFATTRTRASLKLLGLAAIAFALLVSLQQVVAHQGKPSGKLPASELTALDGKVSKSDSLPMESNWVLIYVRPNCRACDAIISELGGRTYGGPQQVVDAPGGRKSGVATQNVERHQGSYFVHVQDAPRKVIVVVGGASVDEVKRMAAANPWIPQGSWYADTSGQLVAQLGLQGAPVIAGVKDGSVKWSYTGVPPKGLPLRSLMSAWHEQRDASKQTPNAPTSRSQSKPPQSKP
jgi:hypothetical protein